MVKHVVKGIAELIRNLLNLELFTVNLVLNVINPEVEENITLHNGAFTYDVRCFFGIFDLPYTT